MCLQRTNSSSFHWSIAHTNWSWNHFCCRCWMHIWLFLLLLCCFVFLPRRAVFTWCPTHTAPLEYVTRQQKQNVDNLDLDDDTAKNNNSPIQLSWSARHDIAKFVHFVPWLLTHRTAGIPSLARAMFTLLLHLEPRGAPRDQRNQKPTGFDAFGSDQVLVLTAIFARRTSALGSRFSSITRVHDSTYTRAIPARIANFFGFFGTFTTTQLGECFSVSQT